MPYQNLLTMDYAPPISTLPQPWDDYDVAQSLHDFAEYLARSQVRTVYFPPYEQVLQRDSPRHTDFPSPPSATAVVRNR